MLSRIPPNFLSKSELLFVCLMFGVDGYLQNKRDKIGWDILKKIGIRNWWMYVVSSSIEHMQYFKHKAQTKYLFICRSVFRNCVENICLKFPNFYQGYLMNRLNFGLTWGLICFWFYFLLFSLIQLYMHFVFISSDKCFVKTSLVFTFFFTKGRQGRLLL